MLRNLATLASRNLRTVGSFRSSTPAFCFSTDLQVVSQLKSSVEKEIEYEDSQVQDLSEFKNFFENQGWKINERGIQVELEKNNAPYSLRILFNAKTPMENNQEEPAQGEEEMEQPDYTDISVYIKKSGSSKWLCCEFMVTSNSEAHMGLAAFIKDYEADRTERQKGRVGITGYTGPELSSLDEKFQETLYAFIEGVGVDGQVLQRASQFSVAYEHQFYVEWLKDFRSLV